jgi:deoxyhypusine synthase
MRTKRNPFRAAVPDKTVASRMYTISAEGANGANMISVTIQLKDARGKNLAGVRRVKVWLSDSATTGAISATGATGAVAVGGGFGSLLNTVIAAKMFDFLTDATGKLRIDLTDAGAKTLYLYMETPDGQPAISSALTWV